MKRSNEVKNNLNNLIQFLTGNETNKTLCKIYYQDILTAKKCEVEGQIKNIKWFNAKEGLITLKIDEKNTNCFYISDININKTLANNDASSKINDCKEIASQTAKTLVVKFQLKNGESVVLEKTIDFYKKNFLMIATLYDCDHSIDEIPICTQYFQDKTLLAKCLDTLIQLIEDKNFQFPKNITYAELKQLEILGNYLQVPLPIMDSISNAFVGPVFKKIFTAATNPTEVSFNNYLANGKWTYPHGPYDTTTQAIAFNNAAYEKLFADLDRLRKKLCTHRINVNFLKGNDRNIQYMAIKTCNRKCFIEIYLAAEKGQEPARAYRLLLTKTNLWYQLVFLGHNRFHFEFIESCNPQEIIKDQNLLRDIRMLVREMYILADEAKIVNEKDLSTAKQDTEFYTKEPVGESNFFIKAYDCQPSKGMGFFIKDQNGGHFVTPDILTIDYPKQNKPVINNQVQLR